MCRIALHAKFRILFFVEQRLGTYNINCLRYNYTSIINFRYICIVQRTVLEKL